MRGGSNFSGGALGARVPGPCPTSISIKKRYAKRIIYKIYKISLAQRAGELFNPIIDDIDKVLAKHYGFTEEELDFFINYDIKYRMVDDK